MATTRSFTVQSSQHPLISYHVAITDRPHPTHGTAAVGVSISCDGRNIATIIGWLTMEQNIVLPDLNHGDLGTINMESLKHR